MLKGSLLINTVQAFFIAYCNNEFGFVVYTSSDAANGEQAEDLRCSEGAEGIEA